MYFDVFQVFNAQFSLTWCRFTVSPVGFSEELVIIVETVCNCDCETQGVSMTVLFIPCKYLPHLSVCQGTVNFDAQKLAEVD